MPYGMGKAVGKRAILFIKVGDRVSVRVVVVVMLFTVKVGPEQKHPGTPSESASLMQAKSWQLLWR